VRLERALLATFALHGLAMLSMAVLLLPGMPGGGAADAVRIHYIASHPWLWRLGWLPWQLTAVSDLALALALFRTPWIARLPAYVTALLTVTAVVPDQLGQLGWITTGIGLARGARPALYLAHEQRLFAWTAAWGATLYTVAALGWTWCFVAARTWNRGLTALSVLLWPLFLLVSLGPLAGMNPRLVAGGNAVGFLALELWLALVAEAVLRRTRPTTTHGRWARWRHSRFAWLDPLGESRFLRAWGALLPTLSIRSDIRDVIYVNYLVEAEHLLPLVPSGLSLDRLGPDGRWGIFTFLSYRHGGFGPACLGPLRRLLPSPVQTNWRIHVTEPTSGLRGVYFLSTAISATPQALVARWLAEGVPMHVLRSASIVPRRGEAGWQLSLDPGRGSAPDAVVVVQPAPPPVEGPWRACFPTWRELLAYVVPQDRVLVPEPWRRSVCSLEIALGIPLEACQPLRAQVFSRAARAITGDAEPFAFRVPAVRFLFREQRRYPMRG
jgi:hypothetical protein